MAELLRGICHLLRAGFAGLRPDIAGGKTHGVKGTPVMKAIMEIRFHSIRSSISFEAPM
jgi:hypothetical protein